MTEPGAMGKDYPSDRAEMQAVFRESLAKRFNDEEIHRAAMLPSWTEPLAERYLAKDVSELLARDEDEMLFTVNEDHSGRTVQKQFWVPTEVRQLLMSEMQSGMPEWTYDFAERLSNDTSADVTRHMQAFARLLMANPWTNGRRDFERTALEAVDESIELHGPAAGVTWLDALEDVALMAPQLDWLPQVSHRIVRRMELANRINRDERKLRDYVERDELDPVVESLLSVENPLWCVHFLGVGGVGKTMLMRYLTARGPKQFGYQVARIDFDFLSADYPLRNPGALLEAVARELLIHSRSRRSDDLFDSLDHQLETLRKRMERPEGKQLEGEDILKLKEFADVEDTFSDILGRLDRVLIIFDTCEELAKLHPDETSVPSLEMTLAIIERLHKRVSSLRVAFAGRRPLAQQGGGQTPQGGWRIESASTRLPGNIPHLALQLTRGFTKTETEQFFKNAETRVSFPIEEGDTQNPVGIDDDLREKIRQLSPEMGRPPEVEPPQFTDSQPRHNPFDIDLYTNWVLDAPEDIESLLASDGGDVYTRHRIINRLEPAVQHLVPIAVMLQRFDKALFGSVSDRGQVDSSFQILSEQEWIETSGTEQDPILTVDRNLLPRLQRYYTPDRELDLSLSGSTTVKALGQRVAAAAFEYVSQNEFAGVEPHVADLIVRWHAPVEAAEFWDAFCDYCAAKQDWGRLDKTAERLLGEDGAIGADPLHPLRAGIWAAKASAALHTNKRTLRDRSKSSRAWNEVRRSYQHYPQPETARCLRIRADLSQPGADLSQVFQEDIKPAVITALPQYASEPRTPVATNRGLQLIAAFLGAVEREADLAEREGNKTPSLLALTEFLIMIIGEVAWRNMTDGNAQQMAVLQLASRALLFRLSDDQSAESSRIVLEQLKAPVNAGQVWFDWLTPTDPKANLALHWLQNGNYYDVRVTDVTVWESLLDHFDFDGNWISQQQENVDRERLLSASIRYALEHEVISLETIDRIWRIYEFNLSVPKCLAHEAARPVQLALIEAMADMGMPLRSMQLLDELVNANRKTLTDTFRLTISQLRLQIARRHRLHDELSDAEELAKTTGLRMDAVAAIMVNLPMTEDRKATYASEISELESWREPPENLGRRAKAERFLEVAETHLDYRAARKAGMSAVDLFRKVHDTYGELRASILLEMRSANPSFGRELQSLYEKYAMQSGFDVPDVEFIQQTWSEAEFTGNTHLGGWIFRLMALQARTQLMQSRNTPEEPTVREAFDVYRIALSVDFYDSLPRELDWVLGASTDKPKSLATVIGETIVRIGMPVLGLAMIAGIAYGVVELATWAVSGLSTSYAASPGWTITLGASLLVPMLYAVIREWWRSGVRFRLQIESRLGELSCRFHRRRLKLGLAPIVRFITEESPNTWRCRESDYSSPAELLAAWETDASVAQSMHDCFRWGAYSTVIELELPAAISDWRWETSLFKLLLHRRPPWKSIRLKIIRAASPTGAKRPLKNTRRVTAIGAEELASQLQSPQLELLDYASLGLEQSSSRALRELSKDIVLIYGKAFSENDGTFLALGSSESRVLKGSIIHKSSVQQGDHAAYTLEPRQLGRLNTPLVVLCGASVEMDEGRLESDRTQAAILRRAGAEAFAAGAEAVIVIPAMPPVLTNKIILTLTRMLGRSDVVTLTEYLRRASLTGKRSAIREWMFLSGTTHDRWAQETGVDSQTLIELTNEICVYCRPENWIKSDDVTGLGAATKS